MPKTGTTGLQFFMHKNRKALREQGVYYPATMREPHPTAIQHRFINEYMRRLDRQGPESVAAFPHPIRRVSNEIISQGFQSNFISEELFSYDPAYAAEFLSGFRKNFDTKIVVFLRRQDTWAESMYAQSVRGGYKESFDHFLRAKHTKERMDFLEFLTIWSNYFGSENIIALPYLDKETRSNSVIANLLGLNISLLNDSAQRNTSLSGEAISFIASLRSMREVGYGKFNRIFGDHIANSTRKGSSVMFTPEARAEFLKIYADSNAEVARRFVDLDANTTSLFDLDPEKYPSSDAVMKSIEAPRKLEILKAILTLHGKADVVSAMGGKPLSEAIEGLTDLVESECRNFVIESQKSAP